MLITTVADVRVDVVVLGRPVPVRPPPTVVVPPWAGTTFFVVPCPFPEAFVVAAGLECPADDVPGTVLRIGGSTDRPVLGDVMGVEVASESVDCPVPAAVDPVGLTGGATLSVCRLSLEPRWGPMRTVASTTTAVANTTPATARNALRRLAPRSGPEPAITMPTGG